MRRSRFIAALVLGSAATLSLSACDGVTSPRSDLQAARTRWAERGPSDYTITVSRSCFCPPEATGPVVVTVSQGIVTSRVYATGDTVPAGLADVFPDVNGLFAVIEAAITGGAKVTVTYHDDFGYPAAVYIDLDAHAVDDEVAYGMDNLMVPLS